MKRKMIVGAAALLVAGTASAALVSGFDQRYASGDFDGSTWLDSAGTANAVSGGDAFTTTTTPSGAAAVQNITAGAVNGNTLSFTRTSELGSAGQLTIQSVIRIDDSMDNRSGPFALNQTSGWGGLYAGANADGNNDIRGGNIGNTGGNTTVINGSGGSAVAAGTWGVYTLVVDATVATPQLTAVFSDLETGATLWQTTIDSSVGIGALSLGLSNDGVLFGGEQGNGASATDGWGGAIAEVIVYNSALSEAELTQNGLEFYNTYQIPEPATLGLIAAFGGGLLFVRRRFAM